MCAAGPQRSDKSDPPCCVAVAAQEALRCTCHGGCGARQQPPSTSAHSILSSCPQHLSLPPTMSLLYTCAATTLPCHHWPSPLPCHCLAIALPLPCHCLVIAVSLPVIMLRMPAKGGAKSVQLPCILLNKVLVNMGLTFNYAANKCNNEPAWQLQVGQTISCSLETRAVLVLLMPVCHGCQCWKQFSKCCSSTFSLHVVWVCFPRGVCDLRTSLYGKIFSVWLHCSLPSSGIRNSATRCKCAL
jgi:hypothetical protein